VSNTDSSAGHLFAAGAVAVFDITSPYDVA
jgi:hypothetical protein